MKYKYVLLLLCLLPSSLLEHGVEILTPEGAGMQVRMWCSYVLWKC